MSSSRYYQGVILAVVVVVVYFLVNRPSAEPPVTVVSIPTRFLTKGFDTQLDAHRAALNAAVTKQNLDSIIRINSNYSAKFPFPHTYFDGLFPAEVLAAVSKEIPDNPQITSDGCAVGSQKCYKTALQKSKNAFDDEAYFGPATLAMFQMMKSERFTKFLEELTGITGLIPDPEYRGSGVHQTLSGGLLDIHADFNRYAKFDMHRRVNVFVFLNEDWKDSYGGHLELWSKDLKTCAPKIAPSIGRLVVFSSTDFSYHGHPHPLACPTDRSRRSLALYYYTKSRPSDECIKNDCYLSHSTLFQTTKCPSCSEDKCLKPTL